MRLSLRILSVVLAFSSCNLIAAQNITTDFSLVSGIEYDSKLTVVELDKLSQQSDSAVTLGAKASLNWQPNRDIQLKAGYSYSAKDYLKYDEFDLTINQLSADLNKDFSVAKLGINAFLADANLADRDFLMLRQTSLYASRLWHSRYYLRAAFNYSDKSFTQFSHRDADTLGISLDSFVFFNQAKSYLSFSISSDKQSAEAAQFDYRQLRLSSRYSYQFKAWQFAQTIQFGLAYSGFDYSAVTPALGEKRNDSRYKADLVWQFNLNDNWSLHSKLELADYQSNFANADYAEYVASVSLKAAF